MTKTTKNNSIMGYSKIKEVTFNGVTMLGIQTESGKIFTSVKKICEDLGLEFSSQSRKIKKDRALSQGVAVLAIPSSGGLQDIFCLDVEYLPFWLSKISIGHCKIEIQPVLLDFQLKAKDILAEAFIDKDKKQSQNNGRQFEIPKTFHEALLLAAAQAKELEETKNRLAYAEPVACLAENMLLKIKESKRLAYFGKFLKQFVPEMGKNNISTYCFNKGYLSRKKDGSMEAKTEFIVEGKKKFFHMLPYVLEVTGNGKTFSKDCWEIRITPLGAKAVLEHLINDKLLNLKDYNQIMILSSKFFESIDPEDVQKAG